MNEAMMSRRRFFAASAASVAAVALARAAGAQEVEQQPNTGAANAPMEADRYKPVQLAAKGAPTVDDPMVLSWDAFMQKSASVRDEPAT